MIENKVFWKIFKRDALVISISVLILSTLSFYISKASIKSTIALGMNSSIVSLMESSHKSISTDLCKKLPQGVHYFLVFIDNQKIDCRSIEFTSFQEKDLLQGFNSLRIGEATNIFNTRLEREDFYHFINVSVDDVSHSVYLIQDSKLLQDQLMTYRYNIISLTVLILFFVLSYYLWNSLKLSRPITNILSEVFNLSNEHMKNDILLRLENSSFTEIDIIESGIEREKIANKNLTDNLDFESNKFRSLLNSFSDPVMAVDLIGNLLFSNQAFVSTFLAPDETGEGQYYLDLIRNYDLKRQFDLFLKSPATSTSFEISLTNNTDQKRFYLIKADQLINKDKKIYGYVIIFNDITSVKEAENIRIEFVANVSHEVRTPLTAIKGYVQTLEAMNKDNELKEIYETINVNCDRLTNLFNDLLSLSSIESKQEILMEPVEIQPLTDQIISNYKKMYHNSKLTVETDYQVLEMLSNSHLIENILSNLIGNCFKYIHQEATVKISWSLKSQNEIELQVLDNGPGIDSKDLPRLFERFYRVDRSRSRSPESPSYEGSGLGLAIVKSSVNKLGGKVRVDSQISQGTQFTIILPYKKIQSI